MVHLVPWLLFLQVAGLAAIPWAFPLFRQLPDRGYGFSKILGLLVLVYVYWALVTAGLFSNGIVALLLVILLYLAASAVLAHQQWEELVLFLRYRWRLLALEEAVFLVAFFLFVAFRVLVPDVTVTTAVTGLTTEQPMDLAFLAAALRSPSFPVADPWLVGQPISYYHMGYLTLSLPARLAGAAAPVAYNLGLTTVFALAAVGVFSLAANAIALAGFAARTVSRRLGALPIIGGLVAVLLLLVAGNLAGGLQSMRLLVSGSGPDGLFANSYWWWDSTRIIHDGTGADPISEFPAFSFVLGDLHPHLMALPFALLALGLALAWLARIEAPDARWPLRQPGELFLISLIIGALGFLNVWDLPVYLAVFVAAVTVRRLWESDVAARSWSITLADVVVPAAAVAGLALALYLPFYLNVESLAKGVLPVARTGTEASHYVLIWGPFLAAILMVAVVAWARVERNVMTWRSILIALALAFGLPTVWALLVGGVAMALEAEWTPVVGLWAEIGQPASAVPLPDLAEAARRWLFLAPLTTIVAAALIALAPSRWEPLRHPGRVFGYLLVLAGVFAILFPELFFVWDLFGTRMNTVFKLHYQAWLLLSLATGIGSAWVLSRTVPRQPLQQALFGGGTGLLGLLVLASLVYGPLAAATRVRASAGASLALDGLAAYRARFPDEVTVIEWLRRNAPRDAVVLEAVGNDYSDFARVSTITGLPTLLGWEGHELQWRGGPDLFAGRREAVNAVYTGSDPQEVQRLLAFYDVDYVFVGRLERQEYGPDVAERFVSIVSEAVEAYRSGDVVVFRVTSE